MRWQVLILLNALLYGFATILMRTQMLSKKCRDAPYALNCVTYLALMLVAILGVHHFGHVHLSVFRRYYWRFILGGSAFAMSNITIYKLLMRVDAAIASILTTLNAIVTLGLAALLLNEHVTLLQAFGCIILLGATLYGVAATHASRKHRTKGVIPYIALYTVLTAILYGLAATNEKYLLSHVSIGSYMIVGWGWQAIAATLTTLIFQPRGFGVLKNPRTFGIAFATGLSKAVGGLFFVLAQVRSSNVGVLVVISNARLLVVVIFGALLIKEHRWLRQKLVAGLGALAGLAFIFH